MNLLAINMNGRESPLFIFMSPTFKVKSVPTRRPLLREKKRSTKNTEQTVTGSAEFVRTRHKLTRPSVVNLKDERQALIRPYGVFYVVFFTLTSLQNINKNHAYSKNNSLRHKLYIKSERAINA